MPRRTVLTGIKPTGVPHIGNFFGAIKPALELTEHYDARYFIADYHALNSIKDPEVLTNLTYEVAAAWLSCGLDAENVLFYKQSDIPETFELSTLLMAFTAKGLMNRAHAYKAVAAENTESGRDVDAGINMGLYTYPVLMAADILLFDSNYVPVGRDQKQHIEMTADIAQTVNHTYGKELLVVPEAIINESTQVITGLDGRKMSKSYNNTIQLFLPEKKLRQTVMKIITTSQSVEEPKDPETCNIFALYRLFADATEQNDLASRYRNGGMGWGEAKQALFEKINYVLKPVRERYEDLIGEKSYIDRILKEGAEKAKPIAAHTIQRLRRAIGVS